MLKKITIVKDPLKYAEYEQLHTEDVCQALFDYFGTWPSGAVLYKKNICKENEVRIENENDIFALSKLECNFIVVIYPQAAALPYLYISLFAVALTIALKPTIPNIAQRNQSQTSPNNELSSRSNSPRVNGRIPDIFGTVRSTPDLISFPYSTFVNDVEVEHSTMCIGRGQYQILESKDGDTFINQIEGTSVQAYLPFADINSDTPFYQVGEEITEKPLDVKKSNSVNGQTLNPANINSWQGNSNVYFEDDGSINRISGASFLDYFDAGDTIQLSGATMYFPFEGELMNLAGVYTIVSITATKIVVSPLNAEWDKIPSSTASYGYLSSTVSLGVSSVIGPFLLNDPESTTVICNFVAPNGMFKDNGTDQTESSVQLEVLITPVDAAGVPTGAGTIQPVIMTGSAIQRSQVAATLIVEHNLGRVLIQAKRVTLKDTSFEGQISDEVKWRDLYQAKEMPSFEFGNVTIVRSLTKATAAALAVKDRKLNLLVTRQIPLRTGGELFSEELQSTNNAAEILSEVCRDLKIGGRPNSEIDYDNIYSTVAEIESYFGIPEAAEFCYTFDKNGMTFEETITSIANAIFCTAYRRGSLIKIDFEKATEDSTLLFNHRNKLPGSEIRTVQFGYDRNYDGLEYVWVDPIDDAVQTLSLPDNLSNKPKKIESIGIRNYNQAFLHANREWNKIKYQNTIVEFDAIAQGELVLNGDRILVADNTRQDEQDGEILSVNESLVVETSQSVEFLDGVTYTVFLQMYDGTVQSMPATAIFGNNRAMALGEVPLLSLVTDDNSFAKTTYLLVADTDTRKRAFLVTERNNGDNNTSKITAVNYDARYYAADGEYL